MANRKVNKQKEEKETELVTLRMDADVKFPKDYVNQLEYVTDHASSSYVQLLGVAEIMEQAALDGYQSSTDMDGLKFYNVIIQDLVKHTRAELSDPIYDHHYSNIKEVSLEILRNGKE